LQCGAVCCIVMYVLVHEGGVCCNVICVAEC